MPEPAPVETTPAVTADPAPAAPAVEPTPTATPAEPDPVPAAPAVVADPAPTTDPAPAAENPTGELDAPDHPDGRSYTEGYVKGLRTENANWRSKLRDAETQRDEAVAKYEDLLANLGKIGGFTPDDPASPAGEPQDPTAALEAITAERDADREKLRDYARRDAVRTAATAGDVQADAAALLDSTSFLSEIGQLDHNADDYAAQVATAVASFVSANPRFAAAPVVPQRSGGDPSQSTGETAQLTDEQFAALSPAERLKAFADGRYTA